MKRYIKYISAFVLVFGLNACSEEFLEFVPQDQATVGSWYRNAAEIRQATASLYGGRAWFGYNDVFMWTAGDLMAGDMHHNWDQEGQFFYLSYNENNSHIAQGWQGLYDVISFANLIIDDMPTIASGYGVSQDDINAGLAEARFFRGVSYFMLVEFWENVPIVETPAQKVAAGDLQLPKNTASSVYEFARRDLVFAAENLPDIDSDGRVTSWSAKGMLAKLHVTLGQRSLGGSPIGSGDDFLTAANYAADVINNSGLTLFSDYEEMFKIENEHNPEILFSLQWINSGWGTGNSRQARFARHSRVTGDAAAWGGGKCPTVDYISHLMNNAEGNEDLRRRGIYMQQGDFYDYIATINGGYEYEIVSRDELGAQVEGSTPTLTNIKKYVVGSVDDHGYAITNQDSPLDTYMLRLSDVYLLYAEALLAGGAELSGGPGYNAYVAVRERAGLNAPADGNMSFEDLMTERRIEFGMEGMSWFDVKRRYYRNANEALSFLNSQNRTDRYYRIDTNDGLENDPAGYELVPAGGVGSNPANVNNDPVVTFTPDKMVLPVPGIEVVANPNLKADVEPVEYVFEQ